MTNVVTSAGCAPPTAVAALMSTYDPGGSCNAPVVPVAGVEACSARIRHPLTVIGVLRELSGDGVVPLACDAALVSNADIAPTIKMTAAPENPMSPPTVPICLSVWQEFGHTQGIFFMDRGTAEVGRDLCALR
jgi:hypothetical protein